MEVFKVAPYDQNLMVNGEFLTENHLSLGQLKVLPVRLSYITQWCPGEGVGSMLAAFIQHCEGGGVYKNVVVLYCTHVSCLGTKF